jgi:Fibronectin type III domain
MRHLRSTLLTAIALLALGASAAQATSPTVSTLSATNIGRTSATLRGSVNAHGKATSFSFQYGTTSAYGAQTASASAGSGTSAITVTTKVSGLTAGTTYHYRIVASNADGTSAGGDRTFTTAPPPASAPLILATAPFGPGATSVTFTALINPGGAKTTYRFQYGTSTAYGLETFGQSISGTTAQSVRFTIGSLAPRTTYHFRVVASNSHGTTVGPDTLAQTGPFPAGKISVITRPRHASRSHPYY